MMSGYRSGEGCDVPLVQCFARESSRCRTWNTADQSSQFVVVTKPFSGQGDTYVFLAWPSWKHICPTSAADWSPRHCHQLKTNGKPREI